MATDSRGRPVHAGKRTMDDWRWEATRYDDFGFLGSSDYDKLHQSPNPITISGSGPTSPVRWSLHVGGMGHPRAEEAMASKYGNVTPPVWTKPNTNSVIKLEGTTRTALRAAIMAEGMRNRLREGRDLKTGRPRG